jgi:NHS family xanthosine MFS transporter
MGIKFRLIVVNFLEFFMWGVYLITFGAYAFNTLHFTGSQIGAIYATMGISSIFMPGLTGIIADRWLGVKYTYAICHVIGAISLFLVSQETEYSKIYILMLINFLAYMPTISLNYSLNYQVLENHGFDTVINFPKVRVWGTIGFIAAMWTVSLAHLELHASQLMIGAAAALFTAIYTLSLPSGKSATSAPKEKMTLASALGLDAFALFKNYKMAVFIFFSLTLGVCLQITNTFGDAFLHDFALNKLYADTLAVKYPAIILSVSQMSETFFILTIPFFLRRFGIKLVMVMSMLAWMFRFGLFGFGNPAGGLWMLILSCIVYGMAFDFFNISGSLFVEIETPVKHRASAQGLFMMATNGFGGFIGSWGSGLVIDHFTVDGVRDWHSIWLVFAAYALVLVVLFVPLFKYKHNPESLIKVNH